MTPPSEEKYTVKPTLPEESSHSDDSAASADWASRVDAVAGEECIREPDGSIVTEYLREAEHIVDDPCSNRERNECYIAVGPLLSALSPPGELS
jgi:hypothetical protein